MFFTRGNAPYRLLTLEGTDGVVFCRVHDEGSRSTVPSLSEHGRVECATRSLLRMRNLCVFRGRDRDASMVGPGDYFHNVEKPHAHAFTLDFDPHTHFPTFCEHPLDQAVEPREHRTLRQPAVDDGETLQLDVRWVSGQQQPDVIDRMKTDYKAKHGVDDPFGGSLFPHPGLMEIVGRLEGETAPGPSRDIVKWYAIRAVNGEHVDLHSFGARVVKNDVPFKLTDRQLAAKDEFRPVTYEFGPRYGEACVLPGHGGLFLEYHDFMQTMTPMDAAAGGHILLARWLDGKGNTPVQDKSGQPAVRPLEVIAVRIPFGYTLLVDRHCLHGDASFTGTYCMSMTSNHVTMSSADTVFLKDAASKCNVAFDFAEERTRQEDHEDPQQQQQTSPAPPSWCARRPTVVYREPTEEELAAFKAETDGVSFMLQPFSKMSWATTIYRRFGVYPGKTSPPPEASAAAAAAHTDCP